MFICKISDKNQDLSCRENDVYKTLLSNQFSIFFKQNATSFEYEIESDFILLKIGRICNCNDLLEKFPGKDNNFLNECQKIIALKKTLGYELNAKLRGDFIVVIIHRHSLEVEIIRAPLSSKKIFYFIEGNSLLISPDMQLLRKYSKKIFDIDKDKVIDSISRNYALSEQTFYHGISQLESAQAILWSPKNGIKKRIFWEAKYHPIERHKNDYSEELFQHLSRAIITLADLDKKFFCLLSGGLDSSPIVGILAQRNFNIEAFSDYSDRKYSKETGCSNRKTNSKLLSDFEKMYPHILFHRFNTAETDKKFSDITRFCFENSDGPCHSPTNQLWILPAYEMAYQRGFKKIFCGAMGNLAFSFNAKTYPKKNINFYLKKINRINKNSLKNFLKIGHEKDSPINLLNSEIIFGVEKAEIIQIESEINQEEKIEKLINFYRRSYGGSSGILNSFLCHFNIDTLDPTANLDLIEYALTIPIDEFENRNVTRNAIKKVVPDSIRENQYSGVQAPYWYVPLKKELKSYLSLIEKFKKNQLIAEVVNLELLKSLLLQVNDLPVYQLGVRHKINLTHCLHVCEWISLHD